MKTDIKVLLFFLAFLSLFSGLPINGQWSWPYQYVLNEGPRQLMAGIERGDINYFWLFHWLFISVTHLLMVLFPFVFSKIKQFGMWITLTPLLFLIMQFQLYGIFLFVFIPFMLIWISIILLVNSQEKKRLIKLNDPAMLRMFMKRSIRTLLFALAFLSLFSCVFISDNRGFTFRYLIFDGPAILSKNFKHDHAYYIRQFQLIFLVIANLILVLFPFIFHKMKNFMVWLIVVPLLFLLLQFSAYLILLIPFIVIWIILIEKLKKYNMLVKKGLPNS